MENLQLVMTIGQSLLLFGNLCIMLYAFKKFLNKPHNDLEVRVTELEVVVKQHDESLKQDNEQFRKQADFNEVFINCMLAFIDFEIAYCHHTGYEFDEDVTKARDTLQKYLAKK